MKSVALSKQGSKSEHNEDAYLVLGKKGIFIVADGVGGGPAGEVASRCVVDTIGERLKDEEISKSLVLDTVNFANERVKDAAMKLRQQGMASTVVIAWLVGNQLKCFHVGDSRIYRLRNAHLEQLTEDHSKHIKKANGERKAVVTQAIGVKDKVIPGYSNYEWQDEDVLVLMSDGVSDVLDNEAISDILTNTRMSMFDKARLLISSSEQQGCTDDKTVVIVFN